LIAANVAAFVLTWSGALGSFENVIARYGLEHGAGFQPWQWLTSNFIHRDILHLAGNMLFLWGLGLVVEGKIGWQKFLGLYLGLGIAECAIEQTMLSFVRFDSYGSSAIIFGLLAVALVWAPKNDLIVGFWVPIFGDGTFDVAISAFSFIVLAVQGLLAWWIGPAVLLHLIGAILGFIAATVMLRRGWVDCEGWDLFSVLRGRPESSSESDTYTPIKERPLVERPKSEVARPAKQSDPDRGAVLKKVKTIKRIRALLEREQPAEAYELLRRTQHVLSEWQLPAEDHLKLAETLEQSERWNEAVVLWEEFLELHPQSAEHIRIHAAACILERQRRPHAALRMLEPLATTRLRPELDKQRRRIVAAAQNLIDSGVIELDQATRHI
jgi:membrane associated rhomboid family serine protease